MSDVLFATGDFRVLEEELELGVPFESAAILAGYDFEVIREMMESDEIQKLITKSEANMIHEHLTNIRTKAEENPRLSTWLLERIFPQHFSQTNKNIEQEDFRGDVTLRGVGPDVSDEKKTD